MAATSTFDVVATLDGHADHDGDRGGFRGKQGPEFLAHRAAPHSGPLRMVLGSTTYASNAPFLGPAFDRSRFDRPTRHGA